MYWNIWQVACWNRPAIVNCDFNRVLELWLLWAVAQCIPCVFVFPKIALPKNNPKNSKQQHHRMFEHYESQIIVAYCGHIFIWCQNLWNYHLWGKIKRPSMTQLWRYGYLEIPSAPHRLRAYLPIDYFEPSKLLQACAAKQGTKVVPGQTLIDVVLKDCRAFWGNVRWGFLI